MARKDYISILASKPPGYKLAVLGGVAVVLGFLYWQFFYSQLSDDLQQAKNQTTSLEQKNVKLQNDLKEWNVLVLQKKSLEAELSRNQVSLPAASELPSFFLHLQKQASGAGVKLDNWLRLKESAVESYIRVPVSIEITGSFYQINNYFKLLYETDRIITVENMALVVVADTNDDLRLNAKFTASTFRLPDQPPDTNLPEAPVAPKGDKGQVKDANEKGGKPAGKATGAAAPKKNPAEKPPGATPPAKGKAPGNGAKPAGGN